MKIERIKKEIEELKRESGVIESLICIVQDKHITDYSTEYSFKIENGKEKYFYKGKPISMAEIEARTQNIVIIDI